MQNQRKRRIDRAHTVKRALAMLTSLQAGEASRDELIATVQVEVGEGAYGASPGDSFENDKRFLQQLGFELNYRKRENRYQLKPEAHPLLRLPLTIEELDLLAVIQQTFAATPYADPAARLVSRVRACLPPDLRERESHPLLSVVIATADTPAPHAQTLRVIAEAIRQRRVLEFEYRSPRTERVIRHSVQPYDSLEYRDAHFYVEAHNLKLEKTLDYRLDRIVAGTARLLPPKFAAGQRRLAMRTLRYRLAAKVARYGASRRFAGHQEQKQPDGSVIVSAQIARDELFWASKTLLKYGENCMVLEPPELVKEMQRVVKEMAENYHL